MRKLSKLMSLFLVLSMIFMLVPVSALAADKEDVGTDDEDGSVIIVLTAEDGVTVAPAETTDPTVNPAAPAAAATTPATGVTTTPKDATVTPAPAADKTVGTAAAPAQPAVTTDETIAVEEETIDAMTATVADLTLSGGTVVNLLATTAGAGFSFDAAANTLTLDNFTGQELNVVSAADLFKLVLLGTNTLTTNNGFAVDVTGDLNMSGTGTLVAQGQATAATRGGGIHVTDDLTIDSGTYDITAIGGAGTQGAYGIFADSATTNSDVLINGGNVDITAINTGDAGARGIFSYGDVIVNAGTLDVYTDAFEGQSMGIGAADDLVFNGGYTTVRSNSATDAGVSTCLFAASWLVINNGILDLCATGGANPRALSGYEGIYINPCYGTVDTSASCLYLEPLCSKHFKHHHQAYSANPKTGVATTATDAFVAVLALVALMGTAVVLSKRENQA